MRSILFCNAFFSSCNCCTAPTKSFGFLNCVLIAFNCFNCAFINASALHPAIASILRTPAATAPSLVILKIPNSPVEPTCVPPQSSIENFGSIITTRTLSPYFSPNKAIAPKAIASSLLISLVTTDMFCLIF